METHNEVCKRYQDEIDKLKEQNKKLSQNLDGLIKNQIELQRDGLQPLEQKETQDIKNCDSCNGTENNKIPLIDELKAHKEVKRKASEHPIYLQSLFPFWWGKP